MEYGFLKVAAASPEIKVADCDFNVKSIKNSIKLANEKDVKLLVLPELCVCGYTCSDLFLQDTLLYGVEKSLLDIKNYTQGIETIVIVGAPLTFENKLFNCAVVMFDGEILGVVPKKNIPNYAEFYELRYFSPANDSIRDIKIGDDYYPFGMNTLFCCENLKEFVFAVEICEDLWVTTPPSNNHALAGATVIANLSASDEVIGKKQYRQKIVSCQSAKLMCGYIYSDAGEGESTTDMVFASHCIIAENGTIIAENELFGKEMIISEIDLKKIAHERQRNTTFNIEDNDYLKIYFEIKKCKETLTRKINKFPFVPSDDKKRTERCEEILLIQAKGLAKRMKHTNSSAVLGISGGLDSTLALLVAARANDLLGFEREKIVAVTMPCFGTTQRTRSNAERLCEYLGVTLRKIDISESVKQHFKDIEHSEENFNVVFENAQARERTQVLMNIANQHNALVVGTGDLSELALGWATYNGDHMSMYGVNGSIPKTLIRHIVAYEASTTKNKMLNEVLLDILDTPVSPELLPAENGEISQKTENIVGPYELHDFFLYYFCRFGFSPKKIYYLACHAFVNEYENEVILKWLKIFVKRFFSQQFKRSCLPDGPKVGSVTLSPRGDWRMPSDACYTLWLKELDEIK